MTRIYRVEAKWMTQAGLLAVVIKNTNKPLLHRCGYVAVPKEHGLFGVNYGLVAGVIVHGGLTYSNKRDGYPTRVKEDVWWLGFDTGHTSDLHRPRRLGYCIEQCENMAHDLIHRAYKLTKED